MLLDGTKIFLQKLVIAVGLLAFHRNGVLSREFAWDIGANQKPPMVYVVMLTVVSFRNGF